MAAGLKKGGGGGGSGDTQRSVTWPQCPAGGSFHGPPPATCWMTIWGSGKPQNRAPNFLVEGTTTTKVKKSVSLIWREVGGGTAAACCCLASSVVRICCLMQCGAVFAPHLCSDLVD